MDMRAGLVLVDVVVSIIPAVVVRVISAAVVVSGLLSTAVLKPVYLYN
jgi:hypothetical protein